MAEIHKLPSHIANLIAAGEVVERPMSVVKEILENSIDAGAKNITIEIENGGISYIRITDDGKGMSQKDAEICFLRHATSKIMEEKDLFSINTLGFRGEALAAISSVSKIDLFTKKSDDLEGTFIKIEGSDIIEVTKTGARDGTTIIIRDLFYNTPARMKFLKKDYTEASYITGMVEKIALSHPQIAFKYIKDGKNILRTNGSGDLKSAIYNILGKEVAEQILEISPCSIDGITVSGYISKPNFGKSTRNLQFLFINGRFFKSSMISVALDESYKNSQMIGKFPMCILNIEIDAKRVDVNVHPTKMEVKFENDNKIFNIITMACKNVLQNTNILVNAQNIKTKEVKFSEKEILAEPISFIDIDVNKTEEKIPNNNENIEKQAVINENYAEKQNFTSNDLNSTVTYSLKSKFIDVSVECDDFDDEFEENKVEITKNEVTYEVETEVLAEKEEFLEKPKENPFDNAIKFIGQCFNTYILCEFNGDFIMIDKHAAHERINFNELKKQNQNFESQVLLSPKIINLPREEYGNFVENLVEINKLGFLIEDFSNNCVVVREIPMVLAEDGAEETILEISSKIVDCKIIDMPKIDDIMHTIACKSAIKGNKFTSDFELEKLARRVILDSELNFCPHGRPIKILITKNEVEKMFKRVL